MIDLTPLDVRKKREDFRKTFRGYDSEEVDTFLQLVAERMEELVKENLTLKERTERLQEQVSSRLGRERAVQEALVTAQELRDDIRGQARHEADEILERAGREAELMRKEAEAEADRIVGRARRQLEERAEALEELERKRVRFLRTFRALLERELDVVEVEEGRAPLEDAALEVEFGARGRTRTAEPPAEPASGEQGPASEDERGERNGPGEDEEPVGDGLGAGMQPAAHEEPTAAAELPDVQDRPAGESLAMDQDLAGDEDLPTDENLRPPSGDHLPAEGGDDDPKRWLSSLVERELTDQSDEDSWS